MIHIKAKNARLVTVGLLLCLLFIGWRAEGQSTRGTTPIAPRRKWEYMYDTASSSFPADADKAKINLYGVNGWELTAVVHEQYQTALVFKRPKIQGQ